MIVNTYLTPISDDLAVVSSNAISIPFRFGPIGVEKSFEKYFISGPNDVRGWIHLLISSFTELAERYKQSEQQKLDTGTLYEWIHEAYNRTHYFERGMLGTAWASINGKQLFAIPLVMAFTMMGLVEEDDFIADFLVSTEEAFKQSLENSNMPISWNYRHLYCDVLDALKELKKVGETADVAEN